MGGRVNARHAVAIAFVTAVALVTVPASGTGAPGSDDKPAARIVVKDNFFSPRSVNVQVGDKVRWVWKGSNRHDVAFKGVPRGGGKRGATARRKGKWQRRFTKAGTYKYVCTLFSGMRGTVMVEEPQIEPSAERVGAEAPLTQPQDPAAGALP